MRQLKRDEGINDANAERSDAESIFNGRSSFNLLGVDFLLPSPNHPAGTRSHGSVAA
jgi:hypothetical protein